NDEALGRETLIVQRNGKPFVAVMPYAEYQQLIAVNTVAPLALSSDDPIFERNRAAFQRQLPDLLKTHRGKWVAIVNEKVTVIGDSSAWVVEEVIRKLGNVRVYVQEVLETRRVYRISGPRVVRAKNI
ncbi:hypothetical protein HY772_09455, partial [Candidatus Woesearchaeota archaeon]|nr:hypothetical protein [Candidatus Woesearchaeota archaeon]